LVDDFAALVEQLAGQSIVPFFQLAMLVSAMGSFYVEPSNTL